MRERRRKRSSITVLLILSGIDMLSAALVCSVVLFVVLVGGQANEEDVAGSGTIAAPSLLFVYAPDGKLGPMPSGLHPTAPAESVSYSDRYMTFLPGGPRFAFQMYVLRAGLHWVSFSGINHPFAIELYPGVGGAIRLLVGCQHMDQPLILTFANGTQVTGSCPPSDTSTMQLPAHSHIQVFLGSGQQPPADWVIESINPGAGDTQVLTLHPKNDAVQAVLSGSNRVVEVLE